MSNNGEDSTANTSLLRSKQVSPLPIGPGGKNPTKRQMNDTNTQLTMMMAQSAANTKYDPPVPHPVTKQVTIERFCSGSDVMPSLPSMLCIIGGLCIVYGLVTK